MSREALDRMEVWRMGFQEFLENPTVGKLFLENLPENERSKIKDWQTLGELGADPVESTLNEWLGTRVLQEIDELYDHIVGISHLFSIKRGFYDSSQNHLSSLQITHDMIIDGMCADILRKNNDLFDRDTFLEFRKYVSLKKVGFALMALAGYSETEAEMEAYELGTSEEGKGIDQIKTFFKTQTSKGMDILKSDFDVNINNCESNIYINLEDAIKREFDRVKTAIDTKSFEQMGKNFRIFVQTIKEIKTANPKAEFQNPEFIQLSEKDDFIQTLQKCCLNNIVQLPGPSAAKDLKWLRANRLGNQDKGEKDSL